MTRILRVAVTGPESTGKSELAEALAKHFATVWVPEFSREYLESIRRPYDYIDILAIAKGQYEKELELIADAKGMIFTDTEFIVNKIWCEEKYNKCHPWILEMIAQHPYDLYLLCNTDLSWEADPLRENPDDRDRLLDLYLQELESRGLAYAIISGNGSARINIAIEHVNNLIPKAKHQ